MNQETLHNRLAETSSPYLHQHADNPVAWQPWDEVALAAARASDTPILLSIGYSACHWCHVMAHDCFEQADIAAAMNDGFVNIKLDREERPDIDHIYQLAHQALQGRGGGWPLTVFLDPQDLAPFYIGTYFPAQARQGMPGFVDVLARVREFYAANRDSLSARSGQLRAWLQQVQAGEPGGKVDRDAVTRLALERVAARADPDWGGDQGAPKFPRAGVLEWLLDTPAARELAREVVPLTARCMARRGLQDHLAGGFFRYCVDTDWRIPHFEKMLYDNALLLPLFARVAADDSGDEELRDIAAAAAHGITAWLAREMRAPDGALYSSLDADSEGEEGKYYLWTRADLAQALPSHLREPAALAFGLDEPPNFEGRVWHLLRSRPLAELAQTLEEPPTRLATELDEARGLLLQARGKRIAPARDDKVLTAWNALAIAGLARSARMLDDEASAGMAQRALAGLRDTAWLDGALYANRASPAARVPGFLDDYAFLLEALLEVLQLDFRRADLQWAMALADGLLAVFGDEQGGGFFFASARHDTPLARGKTFIDASLPSGNAVAARALLRLGHLLGETRYTEAAGRVFEAGAGMLGQHPDACPTLLQAFNEWHQPRPQLVVRCDAAQRDAWDAAARRGLRAAGRVPGGDPIDVFLVTGEAKGLPGLLGERTAQAGAGTAWLCSGFTCQAPITDPDALPDLLRTALAETFAAR